MRRLATDTQILADHAAQAIVAATNDLLELAQAADCLDDILALSTALRRLREGLDAIATKTLERADALCH